MLKLWTQLNTEWSRNNYILSQAAQYDSDSRISSILTDSDKQNFVTRHICSAFWTTKHTRIYKSLVSLKHYKYNTASNLLSLKCTHYLSVWRRTPIGVKKRGSFHPPRAGSECWQFEIVTDWKALCVFPTVYLLK